MQGTVRFGLDGAEYEIDLNAGRTQLRDALAAYVRAGRRVSGGSPPTRPLEPQHLTAHVEKHGSPW